MENMSNTEQITLRDGISVPSSSVLGHLAHGETNEAAEPEHRELPITLPVEDKEFVDILITFPPVHHSTLATISMSEASEIEKQTRKQAQSTLWKKQRKKRITASKFGVTCKRRVCDDAFRKQLWNQPT